LHLLVGDVRSRTRLGPRIGLRRYAPRNDDRKEIMENILHYSPVIIVVLVFLIQQRIIVTPEQLERKHREILKDVEEKFVTINSFKDLKAQFSDMKEKIDKIYDCIIAVR
jgi:hypothetical protein